VELCGKVSGVWDENVASLSYECLKPIKFPPYQTKTARSTLSLGAVLDLKLETIATLGRAYLNSREKAQNRVVYELHECPVRRN